MKKYAVASHGKLAEGIKSTLELFVGNEVDITYICAYVDNYPDLDQQINSFFSKVDEEDQVFVFTDLFGGSVNQKFTMAAADKSNVFVIAGFNLPLIVETVLASDHIDKSSLETMLDNSRQAMQISSLEQEKPAATSKPSTKRESTPPVIFDGTLPTNIRVDERLIHGQIAMVWSKELKLHGIIVANDEAAENETQQMALKMAVPSGIKVMIRSVDDVTKILMDPRSQEKRLLVLVRTVKDALRLVEKTPNVEMVNIGNVGKSVQGQKTTFSQFVMLTDEEVQAMKQLVEIYPDTALQNVPSDKKILAKDLI